MPVFPLTGTPAAPQDNALLLNRFVEFTPVVADYYIGANAVDTRIVKRRTDTVEDLGTRTTIVDAPDDHTKRKGG